GRPHLHERGHQDERHPLLQRPAGPARGEGWRDVHQPLPRPHRRHRRRRHGTRPAARADLRQLRPADVGARREHPPSDARRSCGDCRSARGHPAAQGHPPAAQPPPHRERPRAVPRRRQEDPDGVIRAARAAWLLLAALSCVATPGSARAQEHGGGALTGSLLLRNTKSPDLGGALLADLWYVDGALRAGAVLGAALIKGDHDEASAFGPVGLSVAVASEPAPVGFSLRLRGGGWGGATGEGFRGGGFLAAGFHMEYALHPRLVLAAGMDACFLFGQGDTTVFAPGLSLVWLPGQD